MSQYILQLENSADNSFRKLYTYNKKTEAYEVAVKEEVFAAARYHAKFKKNEPIGLNSPDKVKKFLINKLIGMQHEVFAAIFLDTQFNFICYEELSQGTKSKAIVYPRELAIASLRNEASAVIIAHNHPSGILTPSTADVQLTKHIKQALELLDIRLIDHVIVAGDNTYSFAEHRKIDN